MAKCVDAFAGPKPRTRTVSRRREEPGKTYSYLSRRHLERKVKPLVRVVLANAPAPVPAKTSWYDFINAWDGFEQPELRGRFHFFGLSIEKGQLL
jgi:hypothetical protein